MYALIEYWIGILENIYSIQSMSFRLDKKSYKKSSSVHPPPHHPKTNLDSHSANREWNVFLVGS